MQLLPPRISRQEEQDNLLGPYSIHYQLPFRIGSLLHLPVHSYPRCVVFTADGELPNPQLSHYHCNWRPQYRKRYCTYHLRSAQDPLVISLILSCGRRTMTDKRSTTQNGFKAETHPDEHRCHIFPYNCCCYHSMCPGEPEHQESGRYL